ncbi:nuclear transport factor 2 family protein [Gramella sp. GC03-9]|uniref:Nuclear transport factor 2 family protein n=1 Tax=Christiangramia oceanisediminis TaxID=2920386 RepID=A0A9X2IAL0_9FLAO|nr:nuclear transport factor 2 family protein [Gramella oceanisediminis]MCP9199988.1 nuclear transport factor 2 family protein [Gramella oceanisediminis]
MKKIFLILLFFPSLIFSQSSNDLKQMSLAELNDYLFTEMALNKNTEPLNKIATDDFVLIAAPGMIENKMQAIEGVDNLNISSVKVTIDKILEKENIGIVIGVLEMEGTIMNRPAPKRIRYSSVFIKEDGMWKLQTRTMTPMRM